MGPVTALPAELRTERLVLRRWLPEDVDALAAIYAHSDVGAQLGPVGPEATRAQVERFEQAWEQDGFSQWAAVEPASGRLIGRIGLVRHRDWPLAEAPVEVGWTLARDRWGLGLATEGGRACVECWRELLAGESRLHSFARPTNVRSRAVMERLGLTLRGSAHWRGFEHVWYALDRQDEPGHG